MSFRSHAARLALAAVCALSAGSAAALPTYYFDADNGTSGVPGIPGSSASVAKHDSFLNLLSSSSGEGFETFAAGAPTLPLSIFGGTGSLAMTSPQTTDQITDVVCTDTNDPIDPSTCAGRFNTTSGGTKWWESANTFTITFSSAFSAFGFYGTDFGDFDGTLTIELFDASNNLLASNAITSTATGNGSLFFWGFTDSATTYNAIRFSIGQPAAPVGFVDTAATEIIGFDDLIVGTVRTNGGGGSTVPEPTTLALLGLGLAGLAASRKRKPQ